MKKVALELCLHLCIVMILVACTPIQAPTSEITVPVQVGPSPSGDAVVIDIEQRPEGWDNCFPERRGIRIEEQGSYQPEDSECIVRDQFFIIAEASDLASIAEEGTDLSVVLSGQLDREVSFVTEVSLEGLLESGNVWQLSTNPRVQLYQATLEGEESLIDPELFPSVITALQFLNEAAEAPVYFDFNYLTANQVVGCTDAGIIAGSASLYNIGAWGEGTGAHPGGVVGDGHTLPDRDFWLQWAYAPTSWWEQLYDEDPNGDLMRTTNDMGAEKRIAIFDTSPFTDVIINGHSADITGLITVPLSNPIPLVLNVSHAYELGLTESGQPPSGMPSHGLFAAGLAFAVAPESRIELARVLGSDGKGTVATLVAALQDKILAPTPAFALDQTIINLSLGTTGSLTDVLDMDQLEDYASITEDYTAEVHSEITQGNFMPALQLLLWGAHSQGATIVAAAGNTPCAMASYPARETWVRGVMAGSQSATLACYSSLGYVLAPGGDPLIDLVCKPDLVQQCQIAGGPDCPYGVISLIKAGANTYHYAHWLGTSFATPLESGKCALGGC